MPAHSQKKKKKKAKKTEKELARVRKKLPQLLRRFKKKP